MGLPRRLPGLVSSDRNWSFARRQADPLVAYSHLATNLIGRFHLKMNLIGYGQNVKKKWTSSHFGMQCAEVVEVPEKLRRSLFHSTARTLCVQETKGNDIGARDSKSVCF